MESKENLETPPSSSPSTLKSAAEIAAERAQAAISNKPPPADQPSLLPQPNPAEGEGQELRAQTAAAAELKDRLLRTQADFDNYRKRMVREKQDTIKLANEKLLLELLTPLDHFEMGLSSVPKTDDPLRQGMELVLQQFKQFLKSQGVTEIEAQDQNFDPALHEAVAHQESDAPEGRVIQQLRKGYRLADKVLRPATVVVAKAKPAAVVA